MRLRLRCTWRTRAQPRRSARATRLAARALRRAGARSERLSSVGTGRGETAASESEQRRFAEASGVRSEYRAGVHRARRASSRSDPDRARTCTIARASAIGVEYTRVWRPLAAAKVGTVMAGIYGPRTPCKTRDAAENLIRHTTRELSAGGLPHWCEIREEGPRRWVPVVHEWTCAGGERCACGRA